MADEGVLREMHEQESRKDHACGAGPAMSDGLGNEPRDRDDDEEACGEGEQEFERARRPARARRDRQCTDQVAGGGQHSVPEGVHGLKIGSP